MRVVSLLLLAPAVAKAKCDGRVLAFNNLYGIGQQTATLLSDLATAGYAELHSQTAQLAGPELLKTARTQADFDGSAGSPGPRDAFHERETP